MGQVIQIDETRIRDHLGEIVRGTVEEALIAMLDADAGPALRRQALRAEGGAQARPRESWSATSAAAPGCPPRRVHA